MTAASLDDTESPGTLRALLTKRTRRLLLALFLVSVAAFLASASGQFRSIDDENLYHTTHSLTSLLPNVEVCPPSQAPDFLYTRGSHGCMDPNPTQLQNSYQKGRDGKVVSKYGIGEPLAAAPFFVTGRIVASVLSDEASGACRGPTALACCTSLTGNPDRFRANCQGDTHDMIVQTTTLFTNALLTAITLILVVIVSLQLGAPLRGAALIGLAYGFGSFAFAYAKTLGAEPGTAMCLIAAVMFAIDAARTGRTRALVSCGVAAGAALLFRNTAVIFLPVLGVWFLAVGYRQREWRRAARYAALFSLGAIVSVAVLMMFNAWRYGDALSIGYGQTGSNLHGIRSRGSILTGLWGLWLSPGKSVFLYAPFVFLAVAGVAISVRKFAAEMSLLIALVAANTLLFARVRFWSGDWAWGPRYMIIVLPCLAAMCAPLVGMVPWRRALIALAGIGFLFPGALGVLVNFNIFYQRASETLGTSFRSHVYHDWSWQPIWRNLGVLGDALSNVGKPYGFLYVTGRPRLD
ncbi:MAG: hypothetical protein QOC79_2247, partial [Actinomycetota bacterium]|nr:hypothetical protein [Actinomycetota bacterium]